MFPGWPHRADQLVAPLSGEGVGLELVLVHYPVPLEINPCLPEFTRLQFILFIVCSLLPCNRNKMGRVKLILRFGEVSCILRWKLQS